jgi:phytoene synthase
MTKPPGYRAVLFLPKEKRAAIETVAAFAEMLRAVVACEPARAVVAGSCGSDVVPLVRSRIDDVYAGAIELPRAEFRDDAQRTLAAVMDVVRHFEIPRQRWTDLLDGLVADASVRRYATWRAVERHCAQVGGNIAAIVAAVLGVTSSDIAFAQRVGEASRLTQILTNMRADLSHDRIYLPLEDLARFRYSERELLARESNDRFRELIRFEVARARDLFRDGSAGLCWLAGDGSRMAGATFVAMQTAVLDAIERANFDVFAADLRLSTARQLRQLPAAWRLARRRADEAMPIL